jgi:outer membrane protein
MIRLSLRALLAWVTLATPSSVCAAEPVPSPLTLDAAVQVAARHLPALRRVAAETRAAEARVDQATAPSRPQVSARAGYGRATSNATRGFLGAAPPEPTLDTTGELSASLTASQLLYDFGRVEGRARSADAAVVAQQATAQATERQAVLEVRSAFIDARAQAAFLAVAQETASDRERHVQRVEAFVTAGTRPPIDIVQARADLADARVQLVEAENALATARVRLDLSMGLVAPSPYLLADDAPAALPEEDLAPGALLERAVEVSAEARTLDAQLAAARASQDAARADYSPALSAQAQVDDRGPDPSALVWNLSAGVTLTWPIYEGGVTDAQVREADARVVAASAALEATRQRVRWTVEQARLGIRSGRASVAAADEALKFARERLTLAERRYTEGVGNAIELSDAQLAHARAGAQRVRAERDLAVARARLLDALGR